MNEKAKTEIFCYFEKEKKDICQVEKMEILYLWI